MKGFLCLLAVAFLCQSLLCEDISSVAEYEKPSGGVFIQGELPKRDISNDKIRTHTSTKVNTTRVRIEEEEPETTTQEEPELLPETETEPQDEREPQTEDEPETHTHDELLPEDESSTEPQVELVAITDISFLPCSFIPCPFNKKADKNPKFKPVTVNNSNSKPKVAKSSDDASQEYQLSLEFYHSLSFQLLLLSLFCLTMVLLLTAVLVAMYLTKNGLGLKRFRKLENRDCGLNKYNF